MDFAELLDAAAAFIRAHDDLTLISHADADGICASAILSRTCERAGKRAQVRFLDQPSAPAFAALAAQAQGPVVFVDMGSSHLARIEELFTAPTLILDHHQAQGEARRALLVNPFLCGLDGTRDISAAGIAWEVASRVGDADDLLPVALIGAQADNQERGAFQGSNKRMLERAGAAGLVATREGARLYGTQSRPLARLIAHSYDLEIPELRKNPAAARRLLDRLGIPAFEGGRERMLADLTARERLALDEELIRRSPHPQARIVHYTLPGLAGALRDTREAGTLLNACGRLGRPELALRVLLEGNPTLARDVQEAYTHALHAAHAWYLRGERVTRAGDLVVIDAGDDVPAALAGTLCSVLVRGREVDEATTVVCLARNADGTSTTKVSARTAGTRDLAPLVSAAAAAVGGEGGGHAVAAGAVIPSAQEAAFVDALLRGAAVRR